MSEILENQTFVFIAMSALIFVLTQFIKMPIKYGTKHIHFSDDEQKDAFARKMFNATILLIPFGLGILAEFLYCTIYLHMAFTAITGLNYGTGAVSLYGIVERFLKKKIANPYSDTEEGKALVEAVKKVTADGKIDKNDADPVKAFWKKVK